MKWLSVCLGLLAFFTIAVTVFNVPSSTVFLAAALLACPLMHVWMMKSGKHKH